MEKKKDELLNFAFNEQDEKIKFYRETLVEMTKGLIGYTPMHKLAEDAGKITEEIMKKVDEFEQEKTNMWSPNYNPSYNMTTTIIDHLGFEGNKQKANPDFLKTEPMRTIVDNGPQYPSDNNEELDYVCKLTQWDIDDLKQRLNLAIKAFDKYKTDGEEFKQSAEDVLKMYINDVIEFLDNKNNIRTKCQNNQIARKIEKANQKSYGTLGEHWKELMDLFEMKNEAVDLKEYVEFYKESKKRGYNCYHAFQNGSICAEKRHKNDLTLKSIADSLGIEFIEDFVKACKKCEE